MSASIELQKKHTWCNVALVIQIRRHARMVRHLPDNTINPKSGNPGLEFITEQHIARLEVSMQHMRSMVVVKVCQPLSYSHSDPHPVLPGDTEFRRADEILQASTLQVVIDDADLALPVEESQHLGDVLVPDFRQCFHLVLGCSECQLA